MEGQFIREVERVMREKGLTQAEYARQQGVSRQQVNQYFTGKRGLLTDSAADLLEYLGVEIRLVPKEAKDA